MDWFHGWPSLSPSCTKENRYPPGLKSNGPNVLGMAAPLIVIVPVFAACRPCFGFDFGPFATVAVVVAVTVGMDCAVSVVVEVELTPHAVARMVTRHPNGITTGTVGDTALTPRFQRRERARRPRLSITIAADSPYITSSTHPWRSRIMDFEAAG